MKKLLDLPMEVAKAFLRDMRAYFAEPNAIKRDEIAARQMHALRQYQGPREKSLRLHDIRELFEEMKDLPVRAASLPPRLAVPLDIRWGMNMHVVVAFISAVILVVLAILHMRSPGASPGRDFATIVIIATMVTLRNAF